LNFLNFIDATIALECNLVQNNKMIYFKINDIYFDMNPFNDVTEPNKYNKKLIKTNVILKV
jgi:hypothetical protein